MHLHTLSLSLLAEPFVLAITSTPTLEFYNNSVTISFSILGDHPPVDPDNGIEWTFQQPSQSDSTVINENAYERYSFSNNNETLTINRARVEDSGTYSLTASNEGGSHTASVAINVVGKEGNITTIIVYHLFIRSGAND